MSDGQTTDDRLSAYLRSLPYSHRRADEIAVTSIRQAITSGVLAPGDEIDEDAIAGHLNLSRMPVRQAMTILESEGLVRKPYRRRVRVRELSHEEIVEIYHMRAALEALAVERAVANMTPERLEQIESLLVEIEATGDDLERFSRANLRFHLAIYEASGWAYLVDEIRRLRNKVAAYIVMSHPFVSHLPAISGDHRDIFAACVSGDAARATEQTRAHVLRGMNALLLSLEGGQEGTAG
ncbi:MAG: GntR family transcriptional regulator [Spirochaetota bacterium]